MWRRLACGSTSPEQDQILRRLRPRSTPRFRSFFSAGTLALQRQKHRLIGNDTLPCYNRGTIRIIPGQLSLTFGLAATAGGWTAEIADAAGGAIASILSASLPRPLLRNTFSAAASCFSAVLIAPFLALSSALRASVFAFSCAFFWALIAFVFQLFQVLLHLIVGFEATADAGVANAFEHTKHFELCNFLLRAINIIGRPQMMRCERSNYNYVDRLLAGHAASWPGGCSWPAYCVHVGLGL